MDMQLAGTSVLVTGASKGIGKATAMAFAREGATEVHITARTAGDLDQARADIEGAHAGCKVHTHALDLTDKAARDGLIARTSHVDILVNNAGAIPAGTIDVVDEAAWRKGWELKVFGYIEMTRAFFAAMRERGSGVIVNDIGAAGQNPDFNYVAGSAGNASLMAFTRAMGGASLDHGVRVVGVNPGPVATERMEGMMRQRALKALGDADRWPEMMAKLPGGRAATADEVADLIVFLASPRSAYTTGCIVTLDGGISSRR